MPDIETSEARGVLADWRAAEKSATWAAELARAEQDRLHGESDVLMSRARRLAIEADEAKATADALMRAATATHAVALKESSRIWKEYRDGAGGVEEAARGRLLGTLLDAFGLDPDAEFDGPRAVIIDGAIVVAIDPPDDGDANAIHANAGILVIEPEDVKTLD